MHTSAYRFATEALTFEEVQGRDVVEAGSMNVNGSVREFYIQVLQAGSYLGVDIREGDGVDVVCDASDLPSQGVFDIVISTEMLEHAEDWQGAVAGMVNVLKPGGLMVLTTRSAGFARHDFPGDYWRYSLVNMRRIVEGAGLEIVCLVSDDECPGVFVKACKPVDWVWPSDTGWSGIVLEQP